jgi:YbbR domain-containing protein
MAELLVRIGETLRGNWALKLTAFGLAFLLWSVVRAEAPARDSVTEVPVRIVLRDPAWTLAGPPVPATVNVGVVGPTRELVRFRWLRPEVVVPIDQVRDSVETHVLRAGWITVPGGVDNVNVADISPNSVRLTFDRLTTRLLPVAVTVTGTLPDRLELAGPIQLDPPVVAAHGAVRRFGEVDSLRLPPIPLGTIRGWDTLTIPIDTAGLGLIVSPRSVRIIVPARPATDTLPQGLQSARQPPPGRRQGG